MNMLDDEWIPRIVIVDDSPETSDVLVRHMRLEGYDAMSINDPVEALEYLISDPPDLILLDHNMPRLTGLEVLKELRATVATAEMPVIMVTAAGETEDIVRGLDLGANDYLTKPPQYEVLAARVRTQLKIKRLQDQRRRDIIELTELGAMKDKFLQIAAHDLRNPINNIVIGISLLSRSHEKAGSPIANFEDMLDTMRGASSIMKSIVNDFLDLQAIRTGKVTLALEPVALNDLVHLVYTQNEAYAVEKSVEVRVNLDPNLPEIQGDPDRLIQVISNLISNAIKFSPPGATVGIRTRPLEDYVMFECVDTGPGIPEDEIPLLFQEFSRLSNKPTGTEKSSGVGLSIAKQLTELHGGQIGVKSKVGHGSLFWFTLPME